MAKMLSSVQEKTAKIGLDLSSQLKKQKAKEKKTTFFISLMAKKIYPSPKLDPTKSQETGTSLGFDI